MRMSKYFIFLVESFLGNFYRHSILIRIVVLFLKYKAATNFDFKYLITKTSSNYLDAAIKL